MKASIRRTVTATLAVAAMTGFAATAVFAGPVTETKPQCSSATALLLGGDGTNGDAQLGRIRGYLEGKKVYTIGSAKSGTSGEVGLVEFPVANPSKKGPSVVYGVECGVGAECNDIANGFASKNADSTPVVFCGESVILGPKTSH